MANLQKCLGPLLESFVVQELRKQFGWSMRPPMAYHFRTAAGREVDIVLEIPGGKVVGIEVKAAASVGRTDSRASGSSPRRRATTSCAVSCCISAKTSYRPAKTSGPYR